MSKTCLLSPGTPESDSHAQNQNSGQAQMWAGPGSPKSAEARRSISSLGFWGGFVQMLNQLRCEERVKAKADSSEQWVRKGSGRRGWGGG